MIIPLFVSQTGTFLSLTTATAVQANITSSQAIRPGFYTPPAKPLSQSLNLSFDQKSTALLTQANIKQVHQHETYKWAGQLILLTIQQLSICLQLRVFTKMLVFFMGRFKTWMLKTLNHRLTQTVNNKTSFIISLYLNEKVSVLAKSSGWCRSSKPAEYCTCCNNWSQENMCWCWYLHAAQCTSQAPLHFLMGLSVMVLMDCPRYHVWFCHEL